jgi:hypothetical protein
MDILDYINYPSEGWQSRIKGLNDAGYGWRVLGGCIGMDKMTLWRQCSKVDADEAAWAFAKVSGIEARVWITPDERLTELGKSAAKDKRYRTATDNREADEWTELALSEIERGVSVSDIAKASGMTRDQVNYRLRKT